MVLTLKAVNYDHEEIKRLKRLLPDVMFSPLVRKLLTDHLNKVEAEQLNEQIRSMASGNTDTNQDQDHDNDQTQEPTTPDQEP